VTSGWNQSNATPWCPPTMNSVNSFNGFGFNNGFNGFNGTGWNQTSGSTPWSNQWSTPNAPFAQTAFQTAFPAASPTGSWTGGFVNGCPTFQCGPTQEPWCCVPTFTPWGLCFTSVPTSVYSAMLSACTGSVQYGNGQNWSPMSNPTSSFMPSQFNQVGTPSWSQAWSSNGMQQPGLRGWCPPVAACPPTMQSTGNMMNPNAVPSNGFANNYANTPKPFPATPAPTQQNAPCATGTYGNGYGNGYANGYSSAGCATMVNPSAATETACCAPAARHAA
jgi:hypothetical protein